MNFARTSLVLQESTETIDFVQGCNKRRTQTIVKDAVVNQYQLNIIHMICTFQSSLTLLSTLKARLEDKKSSKSVNVAAA